jgi:hypothetical protein
VATPWYPFTPIDVSRSSGREGWRVSPVPA